MAAISSIAKKWSASALFTRASAGPLEHHGDLPVENQPSQRSGSGAVEVAAGLVFREGKLLITQRYADAHLGGLWEFPGGKRKPTESFPECLTRELLEELGIEIEVAEMIDEIRHTYPEKTVLLRFYRCRWLR